MVPIWRQIGLTLSCTFRNSFALTMTHASTNPRTSLRSSHVPCLAVGTPWHSQLRTNQLARGAHHLLSLGRDGILRGIQRGCGTSEWTTQNHADHQALRQSTRFTRCTCTSAAASMYPDSRGASTSPPPSLASAEALQAETEQMSRELHSLNVAISANILICAAKVWASLISGSSAMLAEAFHSVADILNQVLLRVGVLKAMKAPTARHPYGYMRDRFVWSLISAVGIFFLGAGASVFHGIHTLTETRVVEGAMWSYIVLGVSALLEGYSLMVATKYVMAGARARGMGLLAYVKSGIDPTTVAVMLEDGGAVAGLGIAALCTALTHMTGNAVWDAMGSIAVGGLLGLIAVFLVQKNRDLLLGRSMSNKEIEEVLGHLKKDPTVLYVTDTKTEEIGPRVFRFKAEVAWNGDQLVERVLARTGQKNVSQRLEAALKAERESEAMGRASSGELVGVLKSYGRDIINQVGAEVDRIEVEIQNINPGIRYVDLETDRGRAVNHPARTGSPQPHRDPAAMHGVAATGAAGRPVVDGELYSDLAYAAAKSSQLNHHAAASPQQHQPAGGQNGAVKHP